jgi:hypothetical protein
MSTAQKPPWSPVLHKGSRGPDPGVPGPRYRVVARSRTIRPSGSPDVVTIDGDITDPRTADRIVNAAIERFGPVDTLVNNAGAFVQEIVDTVLCLETAAFVTGEIVHVDGGSHAGRW